MPWKFHDDNLTVHELSGWQENKQTNKQSQTQTDTTENNTTLATLRCAGGSKDSSWVKAGGETILDVRVVLAGFWSHQRSRVRRGNKHLSSTHSWRQQRQILLRLYTPATIKHVTYMYY